MHFGRQNLSESVPMEQKYGGLFFFFFDGGGVNGWFHGGSCRTELNWKILLLGRDNSESFPNTKISRMNK